MTTDALVSSPFDAFDWAVGVTLLLVGLTGVLLLGAHHADEAGHRRIGIALLAAAIAALVCAVEGPLTVLGMMFVAGLYAAFLGLPVAAIVFGVRRLRRRGQRRPAPPS